MPHFHDHFIPSTWVVLREKNDTPAAAAAAESTGSQSCCQQAEAKLQKRFDKIMDTVIQTLLPFREAYQAVRNALVALAAQEQQADSGPVPEPHAA
ncbi:MAG: hypothetical protein JNN08_28475 [Bryobacterales bacterium]|nr:hypothetical protein [Bryobacterales bacterium]